MINALCIQVLFHPSKPAWSKHLLGGMWGMCALGVAIELWYRGERACSKRSVHASHSRRNGMRPGTTRRAARCRGSSTSRCSSTFAWAGPPPSRPSSETCARPWSPRPYACSSAAASRTRSASRPSCATATRARRLLPPLPPPSTTFHRLFPGAQPQPRPCHLAPLRPCGLRAALRLAAAHDRRLPRRLHLTLRILSATLLRRLAAATQARS